MAAEPFALRTGDRVVFVGDTLIEREQSVGYLEVALTTRFADQTFTVRNIGWSADTPDGASRFGLSLMQAGHEPADEGWKQLQKQLQELKPTVLVVGYGMADSFAGAAGLPSFVSRMKQLLDAAQKAAGAEKLRVLLLSPIAHQKLPAPWPDPTTHNEQLASYSAALRQLAGERQATFVDLFTAFKDRPNAEQLSLNGIHLTAAGYRLAAEELERQLGWPAGAWRTSPHTETLWHTMRKKNEWFFHRSRPANMAYIFGFRKGEQGRNASEIPQFDPLIAAQEARIQQLKTLQKVDLPADPVRTVAKAAKFTPQAKPPFTVAEGFEVNLWAENPLLFKPIQMNFDARGRLWVASSEVYPQVEPGQTANDKILILEDTTGAGKADKSTVFADGLLIPTGLEVGHGGVYVAQSTELLHLRDTNGDGKADTRRTVLSGFGTEDTHHNLHTLRWGPDGRLYLNQSIYTRTDTETPTGVARLKSGGTWRLDPRTERMDVLFRGWVNSWGHQFDRFGQSFLTDGAGGDGISYGLPGAMYTAYARARKLLGSISPGGYPKFCSLEIVNSPHFPDDWQGDVITCDFRAHRIVRFKLTDNGAGFVTHAMPDVLRSTEVSFRPIDVKMGPDGALYIADWSNPIINHGEVDFRDPRRDREHGRIWRITAKGRPLNAKPQLVDAPTPKLLDALLSADGFTRQHARRVLIERGPAVLAAVSAWLPAQKSAEAKLEALWLQQAFNAVDETLLGSVLTAPAAPVRAAAVRVAGDYAERLASVKAALATAIADPHPRVRLEAVRALARTQREPAAALSTALLALNQPVERFIDYALWLTVNELAEPWLAELAAGKLTPSAKAIEYVLKVVEPSKANAVLGKLLAGNTLTPDGQGPWIELIGAAGGPTELRKLLDHALAANTQPATVVRALTALAEASRLRGAKPTGAVQGLDKLFHHADVSVQTGALRLAGHWAVSELAEPIRQLATQKSAALDLRLAAITALRDLRGVAPEVLKKLAADTQEPAAVRQQAALMLLAVDRKVGLPLMREWLATTTTEPAASALWHEVLSQANIGYDLALELRSQPLPAPAATIGLRAARNLAKPRNELLRILESQSGTAPAKVYTGGDIQRLTTFVAKDGNAAKGELIYRRPELKCLSCHAIGGAGGKVGPDMTSLGASAPLDYLAESLYVPNAKIKEGFHAVTVETAQGKVYTGLVIKDTNEELVLRPADGKDVAIAKKNIEARTQAPSLMPAGLMDNLFEHEQRDLVRFLSELGKPGPFDATKSAAAKLWRVLPEPREAQQQDLARRGGDSLAWQPLTTTVAGALLGAEVKTLHATGVVYLATRFDASKAGPVTLTPEALPKSATLWLDGTEVKASKTLSTNLTQGTHTLVVRVNVAELPERWTLRSTEVTFRPE
jgi:putative heme-binding domain-containing protein